MVLFCLKILQLFHCIQKTTQAPCHGLCIFADLCCYFLSFLPLLSATLMCEPPSLFPVWASATSECSPVLVTLPAAELCPRPMQGCFLHFQSELKQYLVSPSPVPTSCPWSLCPYFSSFRALFTTFRGALLSTWHCFLCCVCVCLQWNITSITQGPRRFLVSPMPSRMTADTQEVPGLKFKSLPFLSLTNTSITYLWALPYTFKLALRDKAVPRISVESLPCA